MFLLPADQVFADYTEQLKIQLNIYTPTNKGERDKLTEIFQSILYRTEISPLSFHLCL